MAHHSWKRMLLIPYSAICSPILRGDEIIFFGGNLRLIAINAGSTNSTWVSSRCTDPLDPSCRFFRYLPLLPVSHLILHVHAHIIQIGHALCCQKLLLVHHAFLDHLFILDCEKLVEIVEVKVLPAF